MMSLFKTNVFGQFLILKRILIGLIGLFTYHRFNGINRIKISGMEHLEGLPPQKVLFVSNHQTYYADVICFYHVLCSFRNGYRNEIKWWAALNPFLNFYYIAAAETMNTGFIPKLFAYTGSVSVKRTWKEAGKKIQREVDKKDVRNISIALQNGWVMTFPQGTTTPFAPGRKGTAILIKDLQPIVVPVVMEGWRTAFDKTGLKIRKRNVQLSMRIKAPLNIDYANQDIASILAQVMDAIEQSEKFHPKVQAMLAFDQSI